MKTAVKKLLIAALALLLAGCTQASAWFSGESADSAALGENQSVLYGKVTAANGNEITVALGTKKESAEQNAASAQENSPAGEGSNDEARGGDNSAQSYAGKRSAGGAPDGEAFGGIPGGEMPDGEASGGMPGRAGRVQLDLTGEERTFLIPVGTPVNVSVGTNEITTDFMYIVVDNILQMTVQNDGEKQTVVSIDILGS